MVKNRKNKLKQWLLIISVIIGLVFATFILTCTIIYHKYDLDVDKLTSLNNGIKVYSATGTDTTLYNSNRSIVDINTLPDYVIEAFVNIEDKRFYKHNGYDLKRIIKAGLVNLTTKSKSQGASTISQQLIKNALLSNEKTYSRKIKEVVLSIKMEKQFSKAEILEMYLNTIYFGSNAYGIENASKTYFNKSASELTLNEACCLAGLIKSPYQYSPKLNYQNSINRRDLVAKTMLDLGNISKTQYQDIINSDIKISNSNFYDNAYEAQAIIEACNILNISERELINKNYSIVTFKDDTLQNKVAQINKDVITSSEKAYNTDLDSISIVLDNAGCVIAYHVNSNYNLQNVKRQPASLLKPLAVYLPCLSHNILTPASNILDEPINYAGFSPNNADGKFHGNVSTREAIAHSYNIPAVKALDYVGLSNSKEVLEKLGINIVNSDLNLALALGATKNGVNLLDLASAYSTVANMGVSKGYTFIDKIIDENGKIIYQHEKYNEKVLSEDDCFLLTDILKDTATYGTAKRLSSLNLPIASKTGTASSNAGNTDLFNVSYTTEHTILSWVANIKDGTLHPSTHSSVEPTQINKEILQELYSNHIPNDFIKPDGVEKMPYDLTELENSNRLITPNHDITRYIAYDYFKTSNSPENIKATNDVDLDVTISKTGAKICFNAVRYKNYSVVKETKEKLETIAEITETSNDVIINDNNIFNYDKIAYYITENDEKVSEIIEIRPKDYLVNLLNNEIISGKKKWLV